MTPEKRDVTPDQRRAQDALERVRELESRSDGFKKRYRAYADRLAPTVVMNGLGQALAAERAAAGPKPQKDDELAHQELYGAVSSWLCGDGGVYPGSDDALDALVSGSQADYVSAQAEALAWLEWHKKFCRATFPRDEGVAS